MTRQERKAKYRNAITVWGNEWQQDYDNAAEEVMRIADQEIREATSRLSRYVAADEAQNAKLSRNVRAWLELPTGETQ